jgi:hypothetical protein
MDLKFSVTNTLIADGVKTRNFLGGENNDTITVMYEDLLDSVTLATVTIRERDENGVIVEGPTTIDNSSGVYYYVVPDEYNSTPLYTELIVTSSLRDEPVRNIKVHRVDEKIALGLINFNLDMDWIIMIVLGFLALTLTASTASIGALVIVGVAGLFMTFGWFSLSVYTLIIAILVAGLNLLRDGERK